MEAADRLYEYASRIRRKPIPVGSKVYTDFTEEHIIVTHDMMQYNHKWLTVGGNDYGYHNTIGNRYSFEEIDFYLFSDTMIGCVRDNQSLAVRRDRLPLV